MQNVLQTNAVTETGEQYSLAKILGIWALAAVPMGILSWIVFPALSPDAATDPLGAGVTRIAVLTVGLIWTFILSLLIIRQEEVGNNRLVAAIILLSALSIYILLDLAVAVSLILIISSSFALLALALMLHILEPLPLKQKVLLASLIVTAVFSLRLVDWNGRKSFLRDFYQIQPGMTAEEVDTILAEYNKSVSPFVNQNLHGDIQTGTITYLPTAETGESSHALSITFAGSHVIASSFYSD